MQALRLSKLAVTVTLLQKNPSGEFTPVILFQASKKRKKSSPPLRIVETIAERVVGAQKAMIDSYAQSFHESQQKKTNGWLMDMGNNVFKAVNAGRKKLRIDRFPM